MIDWFQLVAEHGPTVWRTIYRIVPHYEDAADCYQETFLAALELERRQRIKDWLPLLKHIAARRAIDRLRRNIRSRAHIQRLEGVDEFLSSKDCPVRQASSNELLERVRRGLARIPEKQASVFWLSCIEELTHRQISQEMRIKENEVRVLLHRARISLQQMLRSESADERAKP